MYKTGDADVLDDLGRYKNTEVAITDEILIEKMGNLQQNSNWDKYPDYTHSLKPKLAVQIYVCMIGCMRDGFTFHGPFDSYIAADEFGLSNTKGNDLYDVVELREPE